MLSGKTSRHGHDPARGRLSSDGDIRSIELRLGFVFEVRQGFYSPGRQKHARQVFVGHESEFCQSGARGSMTMKSAGSAPRSRPRFRESRTAILIDLVLTPLLIPMAVLKGGVPATLRELKQLPGDFARNWKGRHWL